jgi:phage antirepressor YoqD-like protein
MPVLITVKELSEVLDVTPKHVRETLRKLYPEKMTNGKETWLNELEVTAIKLEMQKNPYLNQLVQVKTNLEKAMLIKQAMSFQDEIIQQLTADNERMKPKEIAYDVLMKTDDMMCITSAAKHFNMRQKVVFEVLRKKGYLTLSNLPTQKAIDADIMYLKEIVGNDDRVHPQAVVKTSQLEKFYKAVI